MSRLAYFVRQTLQAMRASLRLQIGAVFAIAVGLLLVATAQVVSNNIDAATARWGRGLQLTIYLKAEATTGRITVLKSLLEQRKEVRSVRFIDSATAHQRLSESLASNEDLLRDIEPNLLPPSLEVQLVDGTDQAKLRPLIAVLAQAPIVDELDYRGHWARRLGAIASVSRKMGSGLALLVALGCLYIITSTIRLGVYARRDQIAIQKLVGATDAFVRAPFLIEGAIQSLFGAVLALSGAYALFNYASGKLGGAVGFGIGEVSFLSVEQIVVGLSAATLLGVCGSFITVGRYAEV